MIKIRLLIVDYDTDFRRKFSNYIASRCSRITISVLGSELENEEISAFASNFDIIICDESAGRHFTGKVLETLVAAGKLILLMHSHMYQSDDGCRRVCKYQQMPRLLAEIPELSIVTGALEAEATSGEGKFVLVTGFSGGCGRTAFSLSLARAYRRLRGGKVLVLSTERYSDIYDYFPLQQASGDYNLNMLILGAGCSSPCDISRHLMRDGEGVYTFIPPQSLASDIAELTEEELRDFLMWIKDQHVFDLIIIDSGRLDINRRACLAEVSAKLVILSDFRRARYFTENKWLTELCEKTDSADILIVESFFKEKDLSKGVYLSEDECEIDAVHKLHDDAASFFVRDNLADISMSGVYAADVMSVAKEVI